MAATKNCKDKIKIISVFTVEDHHEVVPHIHKAIGSKVVPFQDVAMVHFDSHPDLLIPMGMPAEDVYEKQKLYDALTIGNWIIPLVFAGHINEIYWLKPYWANQMSDKTVNFLVGKCKKTGEIRTTCKESYFISELLYVVEDELENTKPVTLTIMTVGEEYQNSHPVSKDSPKTNQQIFTNFVNCEAFERMRKTLKEKKYILDIDLDFYSTKNPFKEIYSDKQYGILKELYSCAPLNEPTDMELEKYINDRQHQLSDLKNLLINYNKDDASDSVESKRAILVKELLDDIKSSQSSVDVDLIHEAGCTIDDSELPHHISSTSEIASLVQITKDILESIERFPSLITISRSSLDDYCPPDQVQYVEESVYAILEESYVYVHINQMYESSSDQESESDVK